VALCGDIGAILKSEDKYAEDKQYSGNCPFLRSNREKYLQKKADKQKEQDIWIHSQGGR